MNTFITETDYDAAIHAEILNAITREDSALLEIIENQAVEEMAGYLASRYDTDTIFSKTGSERHNLILMFAIDITLYHLHAIHNPVKFPLVRKDRYERAIEWLRQVRDGQINPTGLPLAVNDDGDQGGQVNYAMSSNTKRNNHY
jgi:phage gp36-like protein